MTQANNPYLQKQIESASPAQRVVMLYDGAIKFYLQAKLAIEKGDIEARFNANRRATDIVTHLLGSLDVEQGGEVAQRLQRIYYWILKRQMDIDMKNDATAIDEIISYLKTLRKSWEDIAQKGAERAAQEAEAGAGEAAADDAGKLVKKSAIA